MATFEQFQQVQEFLGLADLELLETAYYHKYGGAVLNAFAEDLEWEFMYDAARWTYDEARHTRMGYDRLRAWGYEPQEMPLGSHIYDSANGQDPAVRLGMLHYFETKNIGKKTKRANAFGSYQDRVSQHDMDFDWADETIHAHYGKRWLDVGGRIAIGSYTGTAPEFHRS